MIDKWRDVSREISEERVYLATIRPEESNEDDALDELFRQLDEFTSGQSRSNCFDRLTEMGINLPLLQLLADAEVAAKGYLVPSLDY